MAAVPLDTQHVLIAILAFLAGGFVKGAAAIGLPTVSLAILSTGMDLRAAIALMAIPAACTNIYQALQGGAFRHLVRRHWPLALSCLAGTFGGTFVLFAFDPVVLSGALGAIICLYVPFAFLTVPVAVRPESERLWVPLAGLSTGMIAGATGSLLLPLMVYIDGLRLDAARFVQLTGIAATAITVPIFLGVTGRLAAAGDLPWQGFLVLVPAFAGLWVGQSVRARLSQPRFRALVLIVLFFLGANLARRAFL